MPWVKLDDQFPDHPKVVRAGPAAAWLYVCGLAYCARQLTNGDLPAAQLPKLVSGRVTKLAERLVDVGLWDRTDEGYRVHDYLKYNPTREQVLEQRAATAQRVGGWRSKQRGNEGSNGVTSPAVTATIGPSNGPRNAVTNAVSTPAPVPSPVPQEPTTSEHLPKKTDSNPRERALRQVAPVPKVPAVLASKHHAIYQALVERCGTPANDGEKAKHGRAAKLLLQAGATSHEVFDLADALEARWPEAECTPLAIANNVTLLRGPVKAPKGKESSSSQVDRVFQRFGS